MRRPPDRLVGGTCRLPDLPTVLLLLLATGALAAPASAQSSTYFNQRDDEYTLLGLKRASDAYELARADFSRQQALHEAALLSDAELDAARRRLSEAEVNYQQSILATLFERQYVAVTSAVKLRDGGRPRVRLTLENTSGGGAEIGHLLDVDPDLYERLRPEVVHDVYVALANAEGAVVSAPYESKLEVLRYGTPRQVEFGLLQDLDAVTVLLTYGRGSQREVRIFLEKDETVDRVLAESRQFSQEVELGSSTAFDLDLELFSGSTDTFRLEVLGLPDEIDRHFRDPGSGARLSQLKFTEGSETRRAELSISLPDRASGAVPVDVALPFWALVVPRGRAAELRSGLDGLDPATSAPDDFAALGVGAVRLELVARGVGRLRAKAPQLHYSIGAEEAVEATVTLVNEGSRRLDNLEVEVDAPLGWEKEVVPTVVPRLPVGEETEISVRLRPSGDVAAGRYEARIRSTSFADEKTIEAEDKTVTIEIRPDVRLGPSLVLAGLMVALVFGVVLVGVRLSRR